jgi:hypothetical protein
MKKLIILAIVAVSLSSCILSSKYRDKKMDKYAEKHPMTEKQKTYFK